MADQGKLNDTAVEAYSANSSPMISPNERRRQALEQIDNSPFGWRHVRACIVAGVGFFTDAYDIFAINMASAMLGVVFWVDSNKGKGLAREKFFLPFAKVEIRKNSVQLRYCHQGCDIWWNCDRAAGFRLVG